MKTATRTIDNQSVLMQLWSAVERKDVDGLVGLVHDDMVMEWPQSGERFVGRENVTGALLATEEKGEPTGEPRMVGSGDLWTVVAPVRYGKEPYWYVGIFEFEGGRARRATEFFGAPFPAQPARSQFAE